MTTTPGESRRRSAAAYKRGRKPKHTAKYIALDQLDKIVTVAERLKERVGLLGTTDAAGTGFPDVDAEHVRHIEICRRLTDSYYQRLLGIAREMAAKPK